MCNDGYYESRHALANRAMAAEATIGLIDRALRTMPCACEAVIKYLRLYQESISQPSCPELASQARLLPAADVAAEQEEQACQPQVIG